MAAKIPPHGTYARYQREMKMEGGSCEACRKATAIYHAQYRRVDPARTGPADGRVTRLGPGRCVGGLGWPKD
jgi:hypothetical protein